MQPPPTPRPQLRSGLVRCHVRWEEGRASCTDTRTPLMLWGTDMTRELDATESNTTTPRPVGRLASSVTMTASWMVPNRVKWRCRSTVEQSKGSPVTNTRPHSGSERDPRRDELRCMSREPERRNSLQSQTHTHAHTHTPNKYTCTDGTKQHTTKKEKKRKQQPRQHIMARQKHARRLLVRHAQRARVNATALDDDVPRMLASKITTVITPRPKTVVAP